MLRTICRSHKNADQFIQTLTQVRFYCNKNVEPAAKPPAAGAGEPVHSVHRRMYEVNNFDKKILVWVGRYKTIEEIPKTVPHHNLATRMGLSSNKTGSSYPLAFKKRSYRNFIEHMVETIEKAKNKGRIKFSNYMIVATIFGCMFMAYLGKRAAGRGESVQKMNLDWHQAVKDGKA